MDKEVDMKFSGIRKVCALILCVGLLCSPMSATAQQAEANPAAKTANAAKVNLNSATAEQLTSLPGVGHATARLIIEYRERAGKFNRIEELMNIRGIGERRFETLRDLVTL